MEFAIKIRVIVMERSQSNSFKPYMRQGRLRMGVHWQGAFKQKDEQITGVKQGRGYFKFLYKSCLYTNLYTFNFGFQAVSNYDIELFICFITFK
jgi:hypothetical protein